MFVPLYDLETPVVYVVSRFSTARVSVSSDSTVSVTVARTE